MKIQKSYFFNLLCSIILLSGSLRSPAHSLPDYCDANCIGWVFGAAGLCLTGCAPVVERVVDVCWKTHCKRFIYEEPAPRPSISPGIEPPRPMEYLNGGQGSLNHPQEEKWNQAEIEKIAEYLEKIVQKLDPSRSDNNQESLLEALGDGVAISPHPVAEGRSEQRRIIEFLRIISEKIQPPLLSSPSNPSGSSSSSSDDSEGENESFSSFGNHVGTNKGL
jgi:hypothetical protein